MYAQYLNLNLVINLGMEHARDPAWEWIPHGGAGDEGWRKYRALKTSGGGGGGGKRNYM